jgi:hypothetical protein
MRKYWVGVVCMVVLAVAACGGPLKFKIKGTSRAPDVDAEIIANPLGDQGLTTIKITAEHLAPPDRFTSGGTHYIVWLRKGEGTYARIGALAYNKDKRTAVFEGSAPETAFTLLITAESQVAPQMPSTNMVVEQKVER